MRKFEARFLVKTNSELPKLNYKVINDIYGFKQGISCIIIKGLNPDYTMLLSSIKLIISENGSPLSHLAIVAREYNIPIMLADNITSEIAEEGTLTVSNETIMIENE